jgi:predicted TIM-barrel fold metal-dependent hydrolase
MIIDTHAHAFPPLAMPTGRDSHAWHMKFLQHHLLFHFQGVRRKRDHKAVQIQTLFDGVNDGLSGMYEVNLRPGTFGRVEWTYEGEDYYIQWMPPTLRDMSQPPEAMVAQMDYVGVDKAVLQNAHVYGDLNEYLGECVNKFPNRLIALATVHEWEIDQQAEREWLRRAVNDLRLSGLYFHTELFFVTDWRDNILSEKFDPFWQQVRRLGIPIFWDTWNSRLNSGPDYIAEAGRLSQWAARYPDIISVFTHGLTVEFFEFDEHHVTIPGEIWSALRQPNMYLELLFPNEMGVQWDYPFKLAHDAIRQLYRELGPRKLVLGSDMPAVEGRCTYRQTINYLRNYCDFISPNDMKLILGENALRLFRFKE